MGACFQKGLDVQGKQEENLSSLLQKGWQIYHIWPVPLTLVVLNTDIPCLCRRVDPDQFISKSALFAIKYVNL